MSTGNAYKETFPSGIAPRGPSEKEAVVNAKSKANGSLAPLCDEWHNGWICTRSRLHRGLHVAGGARFIFAKW